MQTALDGTLTWTFPTAFPTGVLPVIGIQVEDNTPNISWNEAITALSNLAVSIRLSKTTSAIQVLGINVLSLVANPQAMAHLTAIAP